MIRYTTHRLGHTINTYQIMHLISYLMISSIRYLIIQQVLCIRLSPNCPKLCPCLACAAPSRSARGVPGEVGSGTAPADFADLCISGSFDSASPAGLGGWSESSCPVGSEGSPTGPMSVLGSWSSGPVAGSSCPCGGESASAFESEGEFVRAMWSRTCDCSEADNVEVAASVSLGSTSRPENLATSSNGNEISHDA